jgi:hypothetical protein
MASIEQKAVAQGLSGKARPRLSWTPRNEVAPKIKELQDLMPVLRKKYGRLVDKYASKYKVDPTLLYAMMAKESGGDERAVSPKGASGLMQLMEPTWDEWAKTWVAEGEQPKSFKEYAGDAELNIRAGAQELSRLDRVFKGDRELMLAGYNLGMGNVRKAQAGKRTIPKETKDYVSSIMGALDVGKPPEAEGGPVPPPDFIGAGARPKPVKPPSAYKQKSMHGGASTRKEQQ